MGSSLDEVLDALAALLDARGPTEAVREAGVGNFRCEGCEDCAHCRFCTDCVSCDDCTYCERCQGCESCTHCLDCTGCKKVTHSAWSADCSESSYLTLCNDCEDCVQCFACVGLSGGEFCILNEKLPRKAYFSRVAALRGALEERLRGGWLPPWYEAEADEEEEVEPEHAVDDDSPEAPEAVAPAENTVDIGPTEGVPEPAVPKRPWSFDDVRAERSMAALTEPELLPESDAMVSMPQIDPVGSDSVRASLEELEALDEPPPDSRDRYGWSVQADETPSRWSDGGHSVSDVERSRPVRPLHQWPDLGPELGPELEAELRGRPSSTPVDLERRRRETAASPGAVPDFALPFSATRREPPGRDVLPPARLPPGPSTQTQLGPEDQTEPDAPVSARARDRADASDAAAAAEPGSDERAAEPPRSSAEVSEDVPSPRAARLRAGRRPQRPAPPVPESTQTGLRRGRAPKRPTRPSRPEADRQADAPSLRRPRRPNRGDRDEEPTAPHPAGSRDNER